MIKIGIIREGKNPPDRRVAFTPNQLKTLQQTYPEFEFLVESSLERCFSDEEYENAGISVRSDVSDAEILFGIKEVPVDQLIPDKTYLFFSHTIKKQSKNRALLQAILEKNIRLIDYEVLKDEAGNRVVAFGRWAGIVGAYNALWTYGQKTGLYEIERVKNLQTLDDLKKELLKVQLPPIKIVVTGAGRVGKGVREVLDVLKIQEVSAHDFLHLYFDDPVFVVLGSGDFNRRKADGGFDKEEFYQFPEKYESHFLKYAEAGEMLIAAAFWNPGAPKLFKLSDLHSPDFSLSVIADITCDVEGSVPTTLRASTIKDPVYDIYRETGEEIRPFGHQTSVSVMAIDNLPCELPRESSASFGEQLIHWVVPALLEENSSILERATLTRDGDLTLEFMYLREFVNKD